MAKKLVPLRAEQVFGHENILYMFHHHVPILRHCLNRTLSFRGGHELTGPFRELSLLRLSSLGIRKGNRACQSLLA